MDFPQAMEHLRARLKDARDKSLEGGFDMAEQMLEQIAQESERFRRECIRQAEAKENEARACRWQADAYSGVAAMTAKVFHAFVLAEERRLAEVAAAEAEKREREAAATPPVAEPEPPKKRRGKPAE